MVAIGLRTESRDNLERIQEGALAESIPGSADWGAALCGRVYAQIAKAPDVGAEAVLFDRIREYVAIQAPSPHQLRWQVSLLFAGAELARHRGRWSDAERLYEACARLDVAPYSPLLGNRTLDALFWLALLALGRGDRASAASSLRRSTDEVRRLASGDWINIQGDPARPLAFGFAEMAQLFDKGARAAYMLQHLDAFYERPGIFAAEAQGFLERQLGRTIAERQELSANVERLQRQVIDADIRAQELAREVAERDQASQRLAREVADQDVRAQQLAAEITRQEAHAKELAGEIGRRDVRAAELVEEIGRRETRARELADEVTRLVARAEELAAQVVAQDAHAQRLAEEIVRQDALAQELAQRLRDAEAQREPHD
jgi:hypothetical protein